jgi:hypothetical protein
MSDDFVTCPRCVIGGSYPPISHHCPLCGYKRKVSPALAAAYRLHADTRSLDFKDTVEIRNAVLYAISTRLK